MNKRRWNWLLWTGFILCPVAILSYFLVFFRYPLTRDIPWVSYLIFAVAALCLFRGLRLAFGQPEQYRGKIAGPILSVLGVALLGLFCFFTFYLSRQLPKSAEAPKVGSRAPDFVLPDATNRPVSLASLLSDPLPNTHVAPKGVLLVFYRGYWWPFCNSELRGIEKNLAELEKLGVRPVAISVDKPEESRDLSRKAGYTFTFLSDRNADVIRRYDLLHPKGGANGQDIARPAEFLLDSSGTIRWVNLTEDLRVRARPEQIIQEAKRLP